MRSRYHRGLGQMPASAQGLISQLNNPATQLANIPQSANDAISHGQNLVNALQSGSSDALVPLAEAGISFITSIGGPQYAQVAAMASDVLGGALAGASIAGPYGAAIGAVAGFIEGLSSLGAFLGVETTIGVSEATQAITERVLGEANAKRTVFGLPQGWAMADWCATAYPPTTTKRTDVWKKLVTAALSMDGFLQLSPSYSPSFLKQLVDQYSIHHVPNDSAGDSAGNAPGSNPVNGSSSEQPLCTPIWWNWSTPSNTGTGGLNNCKMDMYFGAGGAGGSKNTLQSRWVQSTFGVSNTLTQQVIVQLAQQRRPDPLYWGTTLYGWAFQPNGPTDGGVYYFNPDGINAMATVLGMLSRGASPMSIVSELSIQAYILSKQGNVYGSSTANAGQPLQFGYPGQTLQSVSWSMAQAQATIHQLIADYSVMARAMALGAQWTGPECWTTPPLTPGAALPAPSFLTTTGGQVATVAAGAGLAAVVGLLGYSAYTRQSPGTVVKSIGSRAGTRFQALRARARSRL